MPVPGDPGWTAALPTYNQTVEKKPARGWLSSGLSAGVDELQALAGSAIQGGGKLFGLPTITAFGRDVAQSNIAQSAANGRPDLETAPWREGGAPVLPWLGYQAAKQLPILATYMLGGAGYKRLGGAAPAELERLGAVAPRALGGGGARAGADFAARRASIEAGKDFAQQLTGGAIAGLPIAFGSMIQEADQKPGGVTVKDAARAALLSPVYSALDAVEPAGLKGLLARGQTGGIISRVAKAAFAGAAAEIPQEGLQTALEQSFRPDLSLQDKFSNIVDAAVSGGAVGGVFGGVGGIRALKRVNPTLLETQDIASVVDQVLGLPSPAMVAGNAPASNESVVVDAGGEASTQINPIDYQQSEFDTRRTAPRPYENTSIAELQAGLGAAQRAIEAGTASEDVLRFAEAAKEELQTRNGISTINEVAPDLSRGGRATEPTAGDGGTVSAPAPASSQNWSNERDTLLKGIATRRWYREAESPEELDTILRARLENGSTAKSDIELAKRRGIDLNAPAAPVAAEAAREENSNSQAALVQTADEEFRTQWRADVQKMGQKDKGVRAIKPANEVDAQRQIYEALGKDTEIGDGLEKLAQKYGILDDQKRLTPLAVEIASKEPIPRDEAVKAARAHGYKGADITKFVAGVLSHTDGLEVSSRVAGMAAMDGGEWAAERNSVPRGALKKYEPGSYTGDVTDQQVDQMNAPAKPAQPRVVPAEQKRMQLLNKQLDGMVERGELTTDEVVPLKRLVASGAIEVDDAIRYTKSGRGALLTDNPQRKPYQGEVVERGGQIEKAIARARTEQAARRIEQEINDRKQQREAAESIERYNRRKSIRDHLQAIFDEVDEEAAIEAGNPSELNVDDNGIMKYRRGSTAKIGVTVDEVRAAVDEVTKNWKSDVNVIVVDDMNELPEHIARAIERDRAYDAHGFVIGDDVYLIAGNIESTEQAVATVFHEALGHMGLNSLFRKRLDATLRAMYRSNKELRAEVDLWRAANPSAYNRNLARAVEEVLAERSEKGIASASLLSKITALIKDLARRVGLKLSYSDAEVGAILAMAHDQVINGAQESSSVRGLRYMMSLWHGSPHDHNRFLTTKIGTGEGAQVFGWGLYFASVRDVAQHYRDALSTKDFSLQDAAEWVDVMAPSLRREERRAIARQQKYMVSGSSVWRDLRQDYDREWMDARSRGDDADAQYWRTALDTLDALRDHIQAIPTKGKLYNVTVKRMSDEFLDWDKPLSEQSPYVKDALKELGFETEMSMATRRRIAKMREQLVNLTSELLKAHARWSEIGTRSTPEGKVAYNHWADVSTKRIDLMYEIEALDQRNMTGKQIYEELVDRARNATSLRPSYVWKQLVDPANAWRLSLNERARAASMALLKVGIRGNKYFDQFSRDGNGDGSYNYVVFDHDDIEIEAKYSRPAELNQRTRAVVNAVSSKVPIESASNATRRTVFGWNTIGHLVAHYAKQFPQLELYAKAHLERRATQARWSQLFEAPYQAYEQLERNDEKAARDIRYLMSLTEFDIDPTKPWSQHDHLQGAPNEARLKELTDNANRKYNALRGKGLTRIYDDFRAINEATHLSMMSVSLHNLVASDPVLKEGVEGFEVDPTDAFRERASLHESPQNAQRYWSDMLDNQVKRAEEYIRELRGEAAGSASEQRLQSMRLEPIEMRIKSIRESLKAMRDAPYFHLGRHGEHFVSFTLRLGSDKKTVDPAAIDHAGKAISDAGFKDIQISRDSTRPNVYIRVETIEARHQLESIVKKLQSDGWLKPDSEIKAAPRNTAGDTGTADQAPAWLERYIELLQASPMFEPTDNMTDAEKAQLSAKKAQMVSHARELWLDMLPDTAIAKVMVHRNSVPGFDKDMIRNFAFRFQVGVNSLSNLSASAKLTDAFTQMRAAVFDAQVVGSAEHGNVDLLQSLLSEVLVREAGRPLQSGSDWIDTWRALNHAFFLGFSPSYVLVNTTQVGVLLWPELAKRHGFTRSAKAIAAVTKTAFNIMRATLEVGRKVGPKRALDAVITEEVLRKSGIDEGTADYLMKIIADGVIDIGSASRELSRVADGSISENLDTALRWASSFGLYSETFTRLIAALAARKLGGDDIPYAHQVIEQSMLNYSTWNTARQMGKMATFGRWTPVMMSFLQYSAQVLEKLYREFHTSMLSKTASAEDKAAARRFLAGHSVAVTTLAGTLGMPFATVAATVVEKLVDLFDDDDEPFDATAAWRNFMASIFGKEIGEIVSRGVPRALGFDLSQRAGEQNLLPFSQFLTDKRKWREASSEQALRSMGAPVSMVVSIMEGGEKIGNGDILGGMAAMLPNALKGPAKAYQMTEEGYVDTLGNKLPMEPGAEAILAQAVGLTPSARAEYSEARGDQAARKGVLIQRAKVLREEIINAISRGDEEAAREAIRQAQRFDLANPGYAVLPDISSGIRRRARMQALSAATGTPIGVNPKDVGGRDLTGYANIEYRPQ